MEAIDKGADLELKVAATDATNATPSMKELLLTLLEGFHVLETMLYGKKENEVVLDPIALYREL